MPSTVLVTGGAGFIGSRLACRLLEGGDEVRVLDNFSTGRRSNLAGCESDIEILDGDLRCPEDVDAAARGAEVIFHQGALPSVPRSIEDPRSTSAVNIDGTLNVLLAAHAAGARRVVVASSSSVYGEADTLPQRESSCAHPLSPYAVSKLAAEGLCASFARIHSLSTVCLRYFNVFGPGQDASSPYAAVVPRFISAIRAGRPVFIHGDGTQTRDFTYVDDVVHANLLAAGEVPSPLVLNVAGGRATTVDALAQTLGGLLGGPVRREYLPPRPQEVEHSRADIEKARRLLGYEPLRALEAGLALTVQGFLDGRADEPAGRPRRAASRS